MKTRELTDDVILLTEATPREVVGLLESFQVGECWEKRFHNSSLENPRDTRRMNNYVQALKNAGLNIGSGDCQWGYKMPLPENGENYRVLKVFRRT